MSQLYIKRYNALIEHYKVNFEPSKDVYTELHHIIPRCLGGTDSNDNLVRLPARVHFVAHYMLAKAYGGDLWYAYMQMARSPNRLRGRDYRTPSKLYANAKEEYAKIAAARFTGVSKTDDHKAKLSKARSCKKWLHCTVTDVEVAVDKESVSSFMSANQSFRLGRSNQYKAARKLSESLIVAGTASTVTITDGCTSRKISKDEFDSGDFRGVTYGKVSATDALGNRVLVDVEDFKADESLTHHRKGTVIVYDTRDTSAKAFQCAVDDPLYLNGTYINVGKAQGLKQTGENNPNYIGSYVTPYGTFHSKSAFVQATGLSAFKLERCRNNKPIKKQALHKIKDYGPEIEGKTWDELGWSFIPRQVD